MYKPLKILMLATSLEYGGGETHIIELSKYLAKNGIEVRIMSNGGELFEAEIKNAGIGHIYAPFHSRSLFDMAKAKKILKDAVRSFCPDIVHAHSRIPAFVAAGPCKRAKIPLVTTMHGTFKQSFLTRLATNWGDYSLYVSDDVKDYWKKYHDLKDGYMQKTVNAVNTELFSKDSPTDIKAEFDIGPGEKIILNVSRQDLDSYFSAKKLCEIAEDIYARHKDTRIVIVGGGTAFAELENMAKKANAALGFEYITMAGRRADTHKFYAACELFVGISRAALEALSSQRPAIMCGDMGYLGRFSRGNFEDCQSTNFTCRGFGYPENINEALLFEILFCLDAKNEPALLADAAYGAELIRQNYGVEKMADDAYSVYQKAMLKYKKGYDFVLSGYYGYKNLGDDALLFSVLCNILQKKPDLKICLLAKSPKKFQRRLESWFSNITAKPRFNFFSVRRAIKNSDALVFGGGTLLQDATSGRSFKYYAYLLKTAQKLGKKTILYANGIGPLYDEKNKEQTKELMSNITLATIRDKDSFNILSNMQIDKDRLCLTADEALTIAENSRLNSYKKDFREYIKGDYVAICVRKHKRSSTDFAEKFSAAIDAICRKHDLIPVYLVMQPKEDKDFSEYLAAASGRAYVANVEGDIAKTLAIVRSARAVVSMRYHALVFAAVFGIPMIGITYDPKVRSFLGSIFDGDDHACSLKNFSKELLTEKFEMLEANREEITKKIKAEAQKLCESAKENSGLFLQAMGFEIGEG